MTLKRIETKRGHKYELDGKPIKGVTTLIGGGLPKPALPYWSAKLVAEYTVNNFNGIVNLINRDKDEAIKFLKNIPWSERDKAAVRGTDIHNIAEVLIHGETSVVPIELADYVQGYIKWLDKFDIEPILTEKVIGNRTHWYAGTFDAILKFKSGPLKNKVFLCDWKTSNNVYGEMAMQLAAYVNAEFYIDDNGVEQQLPQIDGSAIVHITPNGTTLYKVTDLDLAWQSFLNVITVANKLELVDKLIEKVD